MELIYKIDNNGDVCGLIDRNEAHEQGILHSAVQCWVINEKGEVLIQKRSSKKENSPNKWDVSFGGHCSLIDDKNGFLIANLIKEGKEEIGIDVNPDHVTYLDKYRYTSQHGKNNEIISVFITEVNSTYKFTFNDQEASEVKWVDKETLYQGFLTKPDEFANRIDSANILYKHLK